MHAHLGLSRHRKWKTLVSSKVASQLGLQPIYSEVLSVLAFGARKPKELPTDYLNFDLQLADTSSLSIGVHSVQHLTGKLQRNALTFEDLSEVQKVPNELFADALPLEEENFKPDLLLGINCVLALLMTEALYKLPSGLCIIPSRLGLLIGGSTDTKQDLDSPRNESVSFQTDVKMSVPALYLFSKPDKPLQA